MKNEETFVSIHNKHIVIIFNHGWDKDNVEDWESLIENSTSIYGDKFVTWLIDKDSITYEDLLLKLMEEFENPYLIIEPSLEKTIILDFKLETSKYTIEWKQCQK